MTVVLTGKALTVDEVVRVARGREPVEVDRAALERMRTCRAVVERAHENGEPVYGLSTGVGVLKRVRTGDQYVERFNDRLIKSHLVAQGPPADPEVVRATMVRLANGLAAGTAGVRPEVALRVVTALNEGAEPRVRLLGSVGEADLAQMADLAAGLFGDDALAAGEGLALLNHNAFSTGLAALAVWDAGRLLEGMDVAGALSLEGFAANLSILDPAIAETRPYRGLRHAVDRLRALLEGSYLWGEGAARNLQDPLTFRSLPQIHGACRDALEYAERQLAIELNASQGNPIVVPGGERVISGANFEALPLAAALDFLRVALAPALTSANERAVKLLETPWSGLPTGLTPEAGTAESGLEYLGIAGQGIAAEARLLAQPVSFELASSAHAEGVEDRMTMAPLAARRLSEMVGLGQWLVAIELVVAAQAVEVRGAGPLGRGTGHAMGLVRERVPFLGQGDLVPSDLGPVRELVGSGAVG